MALCDAYCDSLVASGAGCQNFANGNNILPDPGATCSTAPYSWQSVCERIYKGCGLPVTDCSTSVQAFGIGTACGVPVLGR